ncbi:MAG: hypothetical protein JSW11_06370 [Candidatus Heimdallarchaeota archaeon]|nr:MAG: hypothetical protein JSW11_06370 [Candidatus Heimdallarchaeota archaeon]
MEKSDIHESIRQSSLKRLEVDDHELEEWLTLADFPEDTRVNLTPRGRRFIFQKDIVLKSLEPVVSRAQWSRYRSNPEMSIPLSTIRLLVENKRELFMTSFTVTTIGTKKNLLPIKLPIKTKSNSLTKLLALLALSKNVFLTGTYQTKDKKQVERLIETFDSIFDVHLCPEGEITQNQRGFYVKIPVQICSAIVKAFTGDFQASNQDIIRSIIKCQDEKDIVDFVITWLKFSRNYSDQEHIYKFRVNDETRELIKLIEKIGVKYNDGMIRGKIKDSSNIQSNIPVYLIPNNEDNRVILSAHSSRGERLQAKIQNQEAWIEELKVIKEDLENKLERVTASSNESLTWSRAVDERDRENLTEKLEEFDRILQKTRRETAELKRILNESDMITSDESITIDDMTDPNVIDGLDRLRKEVDRLKEQLSEISRSPGPTKELSYKVTQEITMKSEPRSLLSIDSEPQALLKTFLAHPDNWILFILSTKQALSHEQIRNILGIPLEKRMDLHKRLNDFVDRKILKVEISPDGEELYRIDRWQQSDLISGYITTLLGNKEIVPLEIRQLIRNVLR